MKSLPLTDANTANGVYDSSERSKTMAKRLVGYRVDGGELAPKAYAIYEDVPEPRDECARRGIDPDEICADGGVTAEMVVAKEMHCSECNRVRLAHCSDPEHCGYDAGCGQAVITPWQTSIKS